LVRHMGRTISYSILKMTAVMMTAASTAYNRDNGHTKLTIKNCAASYSYVIVVKVKETNTA
jgi:hypothetical protein